MMIERATLLKIARDTVAQRLAARRSLLSAYLTGSVAANEPLLGEATDIDLILIDAEPPPLPREIIRLTDQVALDIQHRHKADYANPKSLRVHPWLGPELCEPYFLHDPTHFFELAQSSARGQFHRPDFVAARAQAFVEMARAELHLGLLPGAEPTAPVTVASLCQALWHTANAVISLTGFPTGARRLPLKLENAARQLHQPTLHTQFLTLFPGDSAPWLADWSAAYHLGQSLTDELIHPARRTLYERGFHAHLQADRAADALWLMLYTWQALMKHLPTTSPQADRWVAFLGALGLATSAAFTAKVAQAHEYLDMTAAAVATWADQNGA